MGAGVVGGGFGAAMVVALLDEVIALLGFKVGEVRHVFGVGVECIGGSEDEDVE